MPQTGAIGAHIIASSPGYSRDAAIASVLQIKGKFAVCVNDPLLCLLLTGHGVISVHRINRNGLLDDNQQQYGNTRQYIQTAHMETPAKDVLIYWNNEPGQQDLPRLLAAGLEAVDEANKLGRTLVAINWSYGNPEPSTNDYLAPLYRALAAGGHYVGVHEGTDLQHPTLASCYPNLIGRFLIPQKKYGFKVLITEFAASLDAHHGWQTWQTAEQYAKACEDTVREVYAPNGVYMTPFSLFPWQVGFDYHNSPELKLRWAEINRKYPVQEKPPVTQPIPAPTVGGTPVKITALPPDVPFRNIRVQPTANATDVGDLKVSDSVTVFLNAKQGEWAYIDRASDGVKGWTLWSGVQYEVITTPIPDTVTYTQAEHDKLVAAVNAVQVELDGLKLQLKGQVSPPSEPFF